MKNFDDIINGNVNEQFNQTDDSEVLIAILNEIKKSNELLRDISYSINDLPRQIH